MEDRIERQPCKCGWVHSGPCDAEPRSWVDRRYRRNGLLEMEYWYDLYGAWMDTHPTEDKMARGIYTTLLSLIAGKRV